jgi:hypothetical protein
MVKSPVAAGGGWVDGGVFDAEGEELSEPEHADRAQRRAHRIARIHM